MLRTRDTGTAYPGHYVSSIDAESDELTVLKMSTFDEEIEYTCKMANCAPITGFFSPGSIS